MNPPCWRVPHRLEDGGSTERLPGALPPSPFPVQPMGTGDMDPLGHRLIDGGSLAESADIGHRTNSLPPSLISVQPMES